MTTYVIGDLQGCLTPLHRLLDHIQYDPASDSLWFVGDLINRGPESLQALRFVKSLGDKAVTVLGNHDLHLLAVIHGVRKASRKDTLDEILKAPDRDELSHWLAHRPLLHTDERLGCTLVHAGIHPQWSLELAHALADEVCEKLETELADFLQHMYGNAPALWSNELSGRERLRFTVNAFTRMRYCHSNGELDFTFNGPPSAAPAQLYPWYAAPNRQQLNTRIIYGHWSSHPAIGPHNAIPTDRGCVWGGSLTAFAIEPEESYWVHNS